MYSAHQRHASPARFPNLSLNQVGLIASPDVGARDAPDAHCAELTIDVDRTDLSGKGVGRIGIPLPSFIEGRRGRIKGADALSDAAIRPSELCKRQTNVLIIQDRLQHATIDAEHGAVVHAQVLEQVRSQFASRQVRRLAGDKGLSGGRGFTGVFGQVGVTDDLSNKSAGPPTASAQILLYDCGRAGRPPRRYRDTIVGGVSDAHDGLDIPVFPQPYHIQAIPRCHCTSACVGRQRLCLE